MTAPANEVRAALAAGRAAAENRQPASSNPHQGDSADVRERVLAAAWMHGCGQGNPMTMDSSTP